MESKILNGILIFMMITFRVIYCDEKNSSQQKLIDDYVKNMESCIKETKISQEDLNMLESKKVMPENDNAKCFFACAYRATGIMNEKGMFLPEGAMKIVETYFSDDNEKLKITKDFIQACEAVNGVTVLDGDKGCERAALLFKCNMEMAPLFDFI